MNDLSLDLLYVCGCECNEHILYYKIELHIFKRYAPIDAVSSSAVICCIWFYYNINNAYLQHKIQVIGIQNAIETKHHEPYFVYNHHIELTRC